MKIVCDACAAKYSIADDKVKGKVFKIRCKKCSNIIVVRGTAGADEAAAPAPYDQKETRVYDYGSQDGAAPPPADDAVWHVVIDQEQVGPITVADVQARFAAGELDAESYVWREGFADWLPMSQVPELAGIAAQNATTAAPPPEAPSAGQDAVASMFGSTAYEEPAAPPQADVFAAHAARAAAVADDGGDLFGDVAPPAPEAAPFGGARAAAASPGSTAAGMKGQRSENSVLFSLNNLAAMASDKPAAAPTGSAQHGGGEGSGLIDIRSMASSYLGARGAAPAKAGPAVGSVDDIPVFATSTFAEPAVIMPVSGGARNNNMLYILVGAVGLLAAAAVVLVIVLMSRGKSTEKQAANTTPPPPATGSAAAAGSGSGSELVATGPTTPPGATDPAGIGAGSATATTGAGTGTAAGSAAVEPPPAATGTGTGSAAAATTPDKPERTTPEKPSRTTERERERERVASTTPDKPARPERTTTPAVVPDKPARPEKPSGGGCIDEVACLLADPKPACCLKKTTTPTRTTTTTTTKPPPDTNLPESLGKTEIAAGIDKVKPKALACASKAPGAHGTVKVSVKVSPGGTVAAVTIKESPDGALGSCVAATVQKATFAKSQEGATFAYPFKF